ncbi:probable carboxylesterase 11 isoform X3 [Prosopis cineraria]|uniref:probable carboxylesterase 11 isoform X3 n=1 Tax=Prosopis cineraria TaxID=364024 RepID=UPI0024106875|nr:probable carboxylesterase 11 isoform X3 [Prosopis cineraria]
MSSVHHRHPQATAQPKPSLSASLLPPLCLSHLTSSHPTTGAISGFENPNPFYQPKSDPTFLSPCSDSKVVFISCACKTEHNLVRGKKGRVFECELSSGCESGEMPSVAVKLYSVFFKFLLKQRLQNRIQASPDEADPFGVTSRPDESVAPSNPSFTDGVATKDIHIDPFTSLTIRIFLPETALRSPESDAAVLPRQPRHSYGKSDLESRSFQVDTTNRSSDSHPLRPNNHGKSNGVEGSNLAGGGVYRGYSPVLNNRRKLPVMLQFHGGGWVSGSNDSVTNDYFCRRIAKLCDVILISVGYRLAPENRYPAAFEDGMKALNWLAKQANLAEYNKSMGIGRGDGTELRKSDTHSHIVDTFGASAVEPWLAAHGDPSRCVLLGVSCGSNIADYVARKAVEAGKFLDPVKVVAQVLMYPFFIGSVPTHSEIKLANSYFYDKSMCMLAWKLFLPEEEFSLDHPAANPLVPNRGPPLKLMPPTLTVVAEHDWMRDRAIAYSEELRKVFLLQVAMNLAGT